MFEYSLSSLRLLWVTTRCLIHTRGTRNGIIVLTSRKKTSGSGIQASSAKFEAWQQAEDAPPPPTPTYLPTYPRPSSSHPFLTHHRPQVRSRRDNTPVAIYNPRVYLRLHRHSTVRHTVRCCYADAENSFRRLRGCAAVACY